MIQAPKGTKDVQPQESYKWQYIERMMREVCRQFGVREVRTPVFEYTELFLRSVGEVTDIVQKEMYTFTDKGGRSISLKPEGTAGVARMFTEHGLFNQPLPLKQYYLANPVFRYENTQAGRLREHHQFGVEYFGAASPLTDAEVISLAFAVLDRLGVGELELHINSIGCAQCRANYNAALKAFLTGISDKLCDTCNTRLQSNPLRILDCKVESCQEALQGAPVILDYLCDECKAHFAGLQENLTALNLDYTIDPRIVRGLDYYTKTVFEIISRHEDFAGTVCGGGRYDRLIEEIGGPKTCAVGFGMGMERLLLVLEGMGLMIPEPAPFAAYLCSFDRESELAALGLAQRLRRAGVSVEMNHGQRSVKAQFKYAGKSGCPYVVSIGEEELKSGLYTVKDMETGETKKMDEQQLTKQLKENRA